MSRILTVTIGQSEFAIRRFDPFMALRLLGDLQRDILPALGNLMQGVLGSDDEAGAETGLADAVRELSGKLDGNALETWANRLLDPEFVTVIINGRDSKLTKDMRAMAFDDAGQIIELMVHIIRHNFADFFLRWAGRFGSVQGLKDKLSGASGPTSSQN